MKQIINKRKDGSIYHKYYLNHLNQRNGLFIDYYSNGNLRWKCNYLNSKLFGISNNKPKEITYHL